ncbi:ADP-ribosylglycohydrolase family protein [Micromonospora auratinigra]|uniref:ADP-ribosylglycohydrolase n=1 Tax=Micromonospora auratinigra TaxID=261654 RepID=A0A1A8Z9I5_9ACTN|nr:ADP-ribosylglycohydrolase family protein [Micromonospora auratinigra]SBT40531.1 ADP-ribosylglycohydrolase [Micromonospora auratinigra]
MHDVLDPRDTVPDELAQLASSGYDVAHLRPLLADALDNGEQARLSSVREALNRADRHPGWTYREPAERSAILAELTHPVTPTPWQGTAEELTDRIHGAWLGRCAGCCLGKPVEGLTRAEVGRYLAAAGADPLTDYLPLLDPLPTGVSHLHESAPFASRGRFTMTPRDDDLDWTILGLHLLETYGPQLTTTDIAREWLDRLPFTQTFTAERAAYRNLLHGLRPPATATTDNPYREWIGALIRADMWGYTNPGDPARAVEFALTDAVLSHVGNGIYGEMWAAALVATAFTAPDARTALDTARTWIPSRSRLREAQDRVLELFDAGKPWGEATDILHGELGHYNWVHTINNAVWISAGLLWGAGDYTRTLELTMRSGDDTDSNGATAGSVFGALHGRAAIPERWTAPLGGAVRSAIRDFDRTPIAELAQRTSRLALTSLGQVTR